MVFTRRQSRANKDGVQDPCSLAASPSSTPVTPTKSSIAKLSSKSTGAKKLNASKLRLHASAHTASTASLVANVDHGVDLISTLKTQARVNVTPHHGTPIKPSSSEMHPHHRKQSTATPYEQAQWLGFFNMHPQTEPKQVGSKIYHALPESPTPIKAAKSTTPSAASIAPKFEFTFQREASLGLSPEAKAVMDEHRAEASRIRAQLAVEATQNMDISDRFLLATGRRIAKPKTRYSDVHKAAFHKMASIANHPSAWRAGLDHPKPKIDAGSSPAPSLKKVDNVNSSRMSPLKRTRSKVDLSDTSTIDARRPSPNSEGNDTRDPSHGAKRVKKFASDDAGTSRPEIEVRNVHGSTMLPKPTGNGLRHLLTPTKASLARSKSASSLKVSRLPSLARANSSANLKIPSALRKVPSENAISSSAFSPTKASMQHSDSIKEHSSTPSNKFNRVNTIRDQTVTHTPKLLNTDSDMLPAITSPSPIKFQNVKSPKAAPLPRLDSPEPMSKMQKFKSILRTPQRLYSDDPGKIAAGTHLATPPLPARSSSTVPATAPVAKHVDFSASALLKAAHDEAKAASVEPETMYPVLPISEPRRQTVGVPSQPGDFTFRTGNLIKFSSLPKTTIRAVKADNEGSMVNDAEQITAKRKRATDAEEVDCQRSFGDEKENEADSEQGARPAKRIRVASSNIVQKVKSVVKKARTAPPSRLPKRNGGLSASRLAFLAQPKSRK